MQRHEPPAPAGGWAWETDRHGAARRKYVAPCLRVLGGCGRSMIGASTKSRQNETGTARLGAAIF